MMDGTQTAAELIACASEGEPILQQTIDPGRARAVAYILVETVVGRSLEVSRSLRDRDWVETVERMVGAFDIMVLAKGLAGRQTGELIKSMIEEMDGVLRVVVCPLSTASEAPWHE